MADADSGSRQSISPAWTPIRNICTHSPPLSAPTLSATSSYTSSAPIHIEGNTTNRIPRPSISDTTAFDTTVLPLSLPSLVSSYDPANTLTGTPRLSVDDDNQHVAHPDCPNKLSCLQDTIQKPSYTLPIIIRAAILGSASGRLTITDIYAAIIEKYPYFATLPPDDSWKVCARS